MPLTIGPKLTDFLQRRQLAVVTTLNKRGTPEMTPIWYSYVDGWIWFNGASTRQWLRRMESSGRATFFLLDPQSGWRWVQVYGRVVEAADDPDGRQFGTLAERYGRPLAGPVPDRRFLRIEITSIKGRGGTPSTMWDVS
jgi:nitroimidazol reductase NimA-like FMN-containing flavoprotein (pyridoxamine 5'-phosphate oxidase superfamily)